MPTGWYGLICCICFEGLKPERCFVDGDGQAWDICAIGSCAHEAGMVNTVIADSNCK